MESVYVKEVNKELWIDLGRNHPTRLSALEEGARILAREVIREKAVQEEHYEHNRAVRDAYIESHNDGYRVPEFNDPDGLDTF